MYKVRTAAMADREQIRALWSLCFGDSEPFMDWFFTERYIPSLSSCLELDGQIVSALQSYPLHVRVRDSILPASMLAGVSTHPEHRGRGYMRRILLHYMQSVRAQGLPVAVYTPAHLSTFFSFGHYPATDTRHLELDEARAAALPAGVRSQSLYEGLAPLHLCCRQALGPYSGMVSRSLADFAYKFRDYASDGARCCALWEDDAVRGYCVYFLSPARLHAEEVAALDETAYRTLIDALRFFAEGRALHAKLPPTPALTYPAARQETRPQGVMGVADVSALLCAVLGDASLRLMVRDASVPQNAGVWNGAGAPDTRAPHITLEAGRLGQLLCGYASAEELEREGLMTVHDPGAARVLAERLPKRPCYIVDEY